jgi:hypothetical protein
MHPSDINVS